MMLPGQPPATTANNAGALISRRTDKICVTGEVFAPNLHSSTAKECHFLREELLVYNFASPVLTRSAAVLAKVARVEASLAYFNVSLTMPSADFTHSSKLES